jgi:hypothetical protein
MNFSSFDIYDFGGLFGEVKFLEDYKLKFTPINASFIYPDSWIISENVLYLLHENLNYSFVFPFIIQDVNYKWNFAGNRFVDCALWLLKQKPEAPPSGNSFEYLNFTAPVDCALTEDGDTICCTNFCYSVSLV